MSNISSENRSERFHRLVKVQEKALVHSRAQLKVKEMLQDCYGDDLSIFAVEGDINTLFSLFGNMLDGVHDSVLEKMKDELKERKVEELLSKLDNIIRRLEKKDEKEQKIENWDKDSARNAVTSSLFATKGAPGDLVTYATVDSLAKERDLLLQQIADEETKISELEARRQEQSRVAEDRLADLQKIASQFEQAADMCSAAS
jgi:hypothetical protein